MDLVHRDDLPPETLAEFERFVQEHHPGMKVVCAGDVPDHKLSDQAKAMIAKMLERHERSVNEGRCFDCGCHMPDFPPSHGDWELPDGWNAMHQVTMDGEEGELVGFVCPACDNDETMYDASNLPEFD